MLLRRLWIADFRCYTELDLAVSQGVTVISGANGEGKTTLLEAIQWLATGRSFRRVPDSALVRAGAERAIVRAEVVASGRELLLEAEISIQGRTRIRMNRRPVTRRRDLGDGLNATVFAPDDLALVKGGPAGRRELLDDVLVACAPRYAAVQADVDRVLRHRNALLRAGVRHEDDRSTLDVFDTQFARAGAALARGRAHLVRRLSGHLTDAYARLAALRGDVAGRYVAEWFDGDIGEHDVSDIQQALASALAAQRNQEIERRTTLVGPQRDEWQLRIADMDARTHASQGEQRSLALALRLASHQVIAEVIGEDPLLLLDDVFSELDPTRARALVEHLPRTQTLLTTAASLPEGITPDARLEVGGGRVRGAAPDTDAEAARSDAGLPAAPASAPTASPAPVSP